MLKKHNNIWNYLGSDSRYFIITGGRGSGKSFEVNRFLTVLSYERSHKILFTRYTLTSASDSIIPEFQEKISLFNADNDFNITKKDIINLKTNSEILFRGIKTSSGDQTAKLKSLNGITTWVLDEAEELTDEILFDKINYSVRKKGIQNRIILILNPTIKTHWIHKRFFEQKGIKDGFTGIKNDTTYIHSTYLDNINNLEQSFLNSVYELKETNPEKFNHIIMGGWLDKADGVIFTNWEYGEFNDSLPFAYGMDFGFFPDPDVLVKCAIDNKNKKLYLKEEFREFNQSPDILKNKVKSIVKHKAVIADCAEKRLISDIKDFGVNILAVKKGAGSVEDGIKLMKNYKIIIHPNSIKLASEFNNYCEKNGVPIDAYNHGIDAARYYVSHFTINNSSAFL